MRKIITLMIILLFPALGFTDHAEAIGNIFIKDVNKAQEVEVLVEYSSEYILKRRQNLENLYLRGLE